MYNNFAVALEAPNKHATRRSFVTATSSGTLFGAVLFLTPEPALVIRLLTAHDQLASRWLERVHTGP